MYNKLRSSFANKNTTTTHDNDVDDDIDDDESVLASRNSFGMLSSSFNSNSFKNNSTTTLTNATTTRNSSSTKLSSKQSAIFKMNKHNSSRGGISSRMMHKLQSHNSSISVAESSRVLSSNAFSSSMASLNLSNDSSSSADGLQLENEEVEECTITSLETYIELNDLVNQFKTCGFPIIVFDRNLTIEYLNNQAEDIFGFFSLSVMGEYLSEILSQESTMEVKKAIEDFCGDMSTAEFDMNSLVYSTQNIKIPITMVDSKEKELRKIQLMKSRNLNAKNLIQKTAFPIKMKIIAFQKMERYHFAAYVQQLQQNEDDIRKLASIQFGEAITEISVIPIISINSKGIIQIFNSASTATFHYSKKDVIGKNVKMLCPPKIRKHHDDYLKRYLTTGEKRVVDCVRAVKGQSKEGKLLGIELRVSEIIDPISKVSSFVAFVRDTKSMSTQAEQITKIAEKIFPKNIVHRLTAGERVIDELQNCTMMYCDIVGFTELAHGKSPSIVVHLLHEIFSSFDDIVYSKQTNPQGNLEKIKTIGDCYFVASGLSNEDLSKKQHHSHPQEKQDSTNHGALNCVKAGISMIQELEQVVSKNSELIGSNAMLQVRIGIHTSYGGVTAAVVGQRKRTYDLFGSDVLATQLIEATGQAGQVHISESTYQAIKSNERIAFLFQQRYRSNQEIYLEKQGVCKLPTNTYISDMQ